MKRTIFAFATVLVVFMAVFAVLVLRPIPKVKAHHEGCTKATLSGKYGLVAPFFYVLNPSSHQPGSYSMLVNFDGRGGFSGSEWNVVINAVPNPANPLTVTGGTYTVNSDCTCTLSFENFNYFTVTFYLHGIIVDAGDELLGSMSDSGDELTGTFDAKKVEGSDHSE